MCLVTQLCPTLCDPMDCSLPGSSVLGDSTDKNTEVGCHALLQGIFPTQGSNSGLPHYDAIPEGVAPAIYAAISSDTGCFRYSNVTPATHRTAAQLIALIPSHADIDRLLFETKTPGRLAAEKAALDLLTFAASGKIAVCSISLEQISAHNLAGEDLDALIDIARSVAGVEIAFSIREEAKNHFRISARSNSTADVSALCAHFGGGGHVKAAGCTISANTIERARELLIERAEKLIS